MSAGDTIFARRVGITVAIVTLAVVALLVIGYESIALFIVFAGILLSLLIKGAARWLCVHTKPPYRAAIAALVVGWLSLFALLVWLLSGTLAEQLALLSQQVPKAFDTLSKEVQSRPWLKQLVDGGSGAEVRARATNIVSGATSVVGSTLEIVGGLVVILFLGIYGALQPSVYVRGFLRLVPPARRPRVAEAISAAGDNLTRWLIGRVFAMAFVGILSGIGLRVIGVPLALTLGIIAGLLTFIEYLGAILSAVPAMLLAATQGAADVVWVVALYTVVHVIDGYVVTPMLARRMVRFPPGFTLAAQVILGSIFGVAGLTLATPVCVVAVVLVHKLYIEDVLDDRDPTPK